MKLPPWLIAALTLALLFWGPPASAFPNHNTPAKAKLPAPAGHGVVISSSGAPRKCVVKASQLHISPVGKASVWDVKISLVLDNYTVKSEFEGHHGFINVNVLPEGEYQFYPFSLNASSYRVEGRGRFSVKAGETVYIGEIFRVAGCGDSGVLLGLEVRDQEARDLDMVKRLRPEIDTASVVKRLAYVDEDVGIDGKPMKKPKR
jgi:hypothetical protein